MLALWLSLLDAQLLEKHVRRVKDARRAARVGPLLRAKVRQLLALDAHLLRLDLRGQVAQELGLRDLGPLKVCIDFLANLVAAVPSERAMLAFIVHNSNLVGEGGANKKTLTSRKPARRLDLHHRA